MINLTPSQKQAVEYEKSVAVVASAGTGKTAVLTQRFLYWHNEKGIPLTQILAFTYTEKAASEMKDRILKNSSLEISEISLLQISTIHSFCTSLLKQNGRKLGLEPDFDILDDDAYSTWLSKKIRDHLFKEVEKKNPFYLECYDLLGFRALEKTFLELAKINLLHLNSHQIKCLPSQTHKKLYQTLLEKALRFQQNALQERISNQQLCFDDLEILTLNLLKTDQNLLNKLQTRYEHILVDEFQDVSPIQNQIILLLFKASKNNLFIVGDPKQSIYSFRKAHPSLFLKAQNCILQNQGISIVLEETFRTPKSIQEKFNTIFPKLLNHNQSDFYTQTAAHKDVSQTKIHTFLANEKSPDHDSEMLSHLISTIKKLNEIGVSWHDMAILSDTRTHFSKLAEEFQKNNIPFIQDNKKDFFENSLISLIDYIFQFLENPSSYFLKTAILTHPMIHFSEDFLLKIIHSKEHQLSSAEAKRWQVYAQHFEKWKTLKKNLLPSYLARTILDDIKLELSQTDLFNFEKLILVLNSWEKQGYHTLEAIIPLLENFYQETPQIDQPQSQQDGVIFSTIHKSKGLEFDHIFLWPGSSRDSHSPPFLFDVDTGFLFKTPSNPEHPNLDYSLDESENFKSLKKKIKQENQDELFRLIYVALTRTKHSLYIFPPKASKNLKKSISQNKNNIEEIQKFTHALYWLNAQDEATPFSLQALEFETKRDALIESKNFEYDQNLKFNKHRPNWTVTELQTFFNCPKKYEWRYQKGVVFSHDALLTNPQKHSSFLSLTGAEKGNFLHEVLQFYDPNRENLKDVVKQTLFNQHLNINIDNAFSETKILIQKLQNHHDLWQLLYDFEKEEKEIEFLLKLKSFHLLGQMDKIVFKKNEWMVLDYKTHFFKNEAERHELIKKYEFQMKCYALAVSKIFNQDAVKTHLIFTQKQDFETLEFTQSDLIAFEETLEALYKNFLTYQKQSYPYTEYKSQCLNCIYFKNSICDVNL